MPDSFIYTPDDVLRMLDALMDSRGSAWWGEFFADRAKPCPFFVEWPDENLVEWFGDGTLMPGRVLELGCGHGRNALYLASQGCRVDAVDFSAQAIDWARERAQSAGATVQFQHRSIFDVTFTEGCYDLVYDCGCFHHLPPHRRKDYVDLVGRASRHTQQVAEMEIIPETAPAPASGAPRWRRFLTPWRSPADQPAWARPALLAIVVVAAVGYGWGMAGASVEPFYGAAARSMSESWHDFIFGAFDPAGTVTVDKLPGALWVQALSLRVFGFHIWALVLPQVVEGVLTILVLYRAVRRLAGPAAGLIAAAVLAVTPITVLLSRGNVSDSLLILLLVLAADATSAALLTGSLGQLLLAGVWVGLAFQAKMIQAWLVLPALAAAYLLAAPAARLRTRCAHVALAGLVTAVVSLSWMTAVSLVPSHDRPYVDGSADDSVYTQVFDYNGLGRLTGNWVRVAGPPSPLLAAAKESGRLLTAETIGIKPSWHRLLAGPFAAGSGWLLPAAVAGALGVLISRRRRGRRDPLRAAVVLWGGWWLVLAVFFSVGTYLNSYYVAALIPAVAALCGTGFAACGPRPWPARVRLLIAGTVLGCVGYGAYLMSGTASGPVVLTLVALVVAAAAAAQLLLPASGQAGYLTAVAFAGAAVLLLPAAASVSSVIRGLGPFDTPFESAETAHNSHLLAAAGPVLTTAVQRLELQTPPADALFGTDTSGLAENYILYSGREVLPIGGYLGNVPAPTLATLRADISRGYVRGFVLPVSPPGPDPRVRWLESRCTRQPQLPHRRPVPYANFFCGPGPASGRLTQRPEHRHHGQFVLVDRPRWSRTAAVDDAARHAAAAMRAVAARAADVRGYPAP